MKYIRKSWFPTFASVFVFIVIAFLDICGFIPTQQRLQFEILCNSIMILLAVLGLWIEQNPTDPDSKPKSNSKNILGNVLISVIAFPMNIDIFGHTIRSDRFLSDLWGWHLFWLIFGIVQILVLSELGHILLQQVQNLVSGLQEWGKDVVTPLGKVVIDLADSLYQSNKFDLFVSISGLALWTGFLYSQLHGSDMKEILTDSRFYIYNIIFLLSYVIVVIIFHNYLPLSKSIRRAIQQADPKITICTVGAIIALAIAIYFFPTVKSLTEILIAILALPSAILVFLRHLPAKKNWKLLGWKQSAAPPAAAGQGQDAAQQENPGQSQDAVQQEIPEQEWQTVQDNEDINKSDLAFVLAVFIIPIIFILLIGITTSSDSPFITSPDLSDATTWLNFLEAAADAARSILELLGLK